MFNKFCESDSPLMLLWLSQTCHVACILLFKNLLCWLLMFFVLLSTWSKLCVIKIVCQGTVHFIVYERLEISHKVCQTRNLGMSRLWSWSWTGQTPRVTSAWGLSNTRPFPTISCSLFNLNMEDYLSHRLSLSCGFSIGRTNNSVINWEIL